MKKAHLLKVFTFSLALVLAYNKAFAQNNTKPDLKSHLADSIGSILENCSDSSCFESTITSIKRNRRKLKEQYLILLHKFAKASSEHNYLRGNMEALDRIGLQYRYNGVYDSAEMFHKKSLQMALKVKDSTQLYYNYNNLGQVYRMQDLSVQAIYYFHKALKISDAIGNLKSSSYTMNTLGASYVVQKEYEQAMYYFKSSADIAIKRNDKRTLAYNYGSMGEVFLLTNENDSAMHYFIESKKLIVELGSKRGLAVAEHLIGQAYFALGQLNDAEHYFHVALNMHKKDKSSRYITHCNAYLGKIKTLKHQNDSAEIYLKHGLQIATEIHSFENLILINDALFELYKQSEQWEKAIEALQISKSYEDSIISIANAKEIMSLEIGYETHKKEQHIKLLSAENKIKSQRIKMSVILIIILVIGVFMGIYVQIMRKQQATFMQNKLRQQLLLSQMNPHFIFNALASIQSYMYRNEAKKAAVFLGNFASLSRSILNNSSAQKISLDEEIETLRNYLELEKLRMNGAFTYNIELINDVDTECITIPPMMLQPFIENAIKHGLKTIDSGGILTLKVEDKEAFIEVEITDNGIGINEALKNKNTEHQSKATEIFNQRLKILRKKYRNIPKPTITDLSAENKTGTKVVVYLPIIEE